MHIAVGGAGLEGYVQATVGVAVSIGRGFAGPIEQDSKPAGVFDVPIEVAVVFAGEFEAHLEGGDGSDGGIEGAHIAKPGWVAVGHDSIRGKGVGFGCLRLEEQRRRRSKEHQ